MSTQAQKLFDLLPALYRLRDGQQAQSQNLLNASETTRRQALQASATPLSTAQQAELDLLNGAVALVHNLTMVTHNVQDYAHIPGLTIDDWMVP